MKAFWTSDFKEKICVASDDNSITSVYLPVAGDPSSLGDHVTPNIRAACQTPLPKKDWDDYVASLPAPAPPAPIDLTPAEKLKAAGLTVEELKALLAS